MATKYEYYTTGGDSLLYYNSSNKWYCQTFTIGTTGTDEDQSISYIKVNVVKGGPSHPVNVYATIKAVDGDGKPTGSALSSGSTTTSDWSYTLTYETINMSAYTLVESTQYALIINIESSNMAAVQMQKDGSSPSYTGGSAGSSTDGSSWTMDTSSDVLFEIWGNIPSTGTNMKINIGDTFKDVDSMQINIGDVWKDVISVQQNIGDVWKTVF